MNEKDWLEQRFEEHRAQLRAVAYRILGSGPAADDALQEAWLRLARADPSGVENPGAWLTTVVARVCFNMLSSERARREDLAGNLPEEAPETNDAADPERRALLADSVGLALLAVLETLNPAERLAFVLHDMFDVPFDQIAPIVDRTTAATRQLASRARRRVRGATAAAVDTGTGTADSGRHRRIVTAFLDAAHTGRFDALLELLDPNAVLRADAAAVRLGATPEVRGQHAAAHAFTGRLGGARFAIIDGVPGAAWAPGGHPRVLFVFATCGEVITGIELVAEPDRLNQADLVLT